MRPPFFVTILLIVKATSLAEKLIDEMSAEAIQHQINVIRCIRTTEYAMKYNKDALKDPSFSYRSEVITTSLYCACNDCIKFCCYGKPIKCIDPYLMDMRYTHYHGLVNASKTASTRDNSDTAYNTANNTATPDPNTSGEEPEPKRRKI